MRSGNSSKLSSILAGAALVFAIPAIGQDSPKSILPPGFGEPDASEVNEQTDQVGTKPSDLLPDVQIRAPGSAASSAQTQPGVDPLAPVDPSKTDEEAAPVSIATMQDLPPSARRSVSQVGLLGENDGDMGAAAFGAERGPFLTHLMRHLAAPVASRWSSILLRRALLSRAQTPAGVNGVDWAAERAWLLLRMGEAESAQQLVQSVDVDQYTPKMFEVAMQAALASADPAGLCPMVEYSKSKEPAWPFAKAICSALSGESSVASAQIDAARAHGKGAGIDGLLAEKVVGAGGNTRRAVTIQWDDVSRMSAWRFGMATGTGTEIPERLMASVGPHVRAWRARAPLLPIEKRIDDSDVAATLGVLSSAALVDQYGAWDDATDPADSAGKRFLLLRSAYAAPDNSSKLAAMRTLWSETGLNSTRQFARLILTARAAARIAPNDDVMADSGNLLGSMFTAGLDIQAAAWAESVESASGDSAKQAWALLAVGAPGQVVDWSSSKVRSYGSVAGNELRGAMLFAGMAGLARLNGDDILSMAESLEVPIGRQTAWTRALERGVAARQPGTVALLCAVGLQNADWKKIPPVQLYHIVSALRRVGLAGEARMIAAEAITRS